MQALRTTLLLLLIGATLAVPARAQITIQRTANVSGGWVAAPGVLEVQVRPMVGPGIDRGTTVVPGASAGYGISPRLMIGADVASQTITMGRELVEWQVHGRYLISPDDDGSVQLALTTAINGAAGSLDAEFAGAYWLGPLRLMGAVRAFTDAFDRGDGRVVAGGGVVVHPLARRMPVAIGADIMSLGNRRGGEQPAWSISAMAGLFDTDHTVSVFATNSTSHTLQGRSLGTRDSRFGAEFTLRLPLGRGLGQPLPVDWTLPRVERTDRAATMFADIRNFNFIQQVIEVVSGTTIEWTNHDRVMHTVTGDDGSWRSGAIRPGGKWRATFSRPGSYPFHCGPHPYMRGVVIVR
jgi:plastocyanin